MPKVKSSVKHQGIGGKEFIIDEHITETLNDENVLINGATGNWACRNFIERRADFVYGFPHTLYCGKVNGLGYIVAEDELEF